MAAVYSRQIFQLRGMETDMDNSISAASSMGIGTVLAAFTMGKMVGIVGNLIDRKYVFTSFLSK